MKGRTGWRVVLSERENLLRGVLSGRSNWVESSTKWNG